MSGTDGSAVDHRAAAIRKSRTYERSLPRVQVRHGAHAVTLATPTEVCLWRALNYFDKEPETIRWIDGMPEGGVLFDVGANIGLYTLWAGVSRRAAVYAFEPEAANYAVLNLNLRLNGLTDQCRAFCVGISDTDGFDTLRVAQLSTGSSGHQVGPSFKGGLAQGIVSATLDHLVYAAGLPCPSHLKIDVDGIEPAIVRGAGRLLADLRLKSVLIELAVMNPAHRAVVDRLSELGFTKDEALERAVYAKDTGVRQTGNIIFTRA